MDFIIDNREIIGDFMIRHVLKVRLRPDLVNVSPSGLLALTDAGPTAPLVSLSLFGRAFHRDPGPPDQFCPAL